MNRLQRGLTPLALILLVLIIVSAGCHREAGEGASVAAPPATAGPTALIPSGHASRTGGPAAPPGTVLACDGIPAWTDAFATINGGDLVTNRGSLYECTPGGSSAWCRQDVYEPGTDDYYPPPDWWPQAWTLKGTCGAASIEGNRLTIRLPAKPASAGKARADDAPVSGVLRCPLQPDNDMPFKGAWGEAVTIDSLPPCNFELIMRAPDGLRPLNTPAIIAVTEAQGQVLDFAPSFDAPFPIGKLKALPGLKVEVFATGLIQPRQMAMGDHVLYVGSSAIPQYAGEYGDIAGFVYAMPLDPVTERPTGDLYLVASKAVEPHGVAYRHGVLYYSTTGTLYRLDNADTSYRNPRPVVALNFPGDDAKFPLPATRAVSIYRRWHQKHGLFFDPQDTGDTLYTGIGTPCNLCYMKDADPRYGSITTYDVTSGDSKGSVYATGIRNSVGMDWNPVTHELWFSDNNRQTTGQDPLQAVKYPEEINRISAKNQSFGEPFVFGRSTIGYTSAEFGGTSDPNQPTGLLPGIRVGNLPPAAIRPASYTPPALELAPGAAILGMKFIAAGTYPGTGASSDQNLLFAAHGGGSENDGSPNVRIAGIDGTKVVSVWPFMTGWQQSDTLLGRPTEFLAMSDGSLLVSDDVANVIYRVSYDAAALPSTELTLHMADAPAAAVKDDMPRGTLVDAAGTRWPFMLAWGGTTTVKGFAPGTYRVEMDDLGAFTPQDAVVDIGLSHAPHTTELGYRERPAVKASITFRAPAKPDGTDVPDAMTLTLVSDGTPRQITVPWDGQVVETLPYGTHDVIYPYMHRAIPVPGRNTLRVMNDTAQTETTSYHAVESIGKTMLGSAQGASPASGGCARCHSDGLAGNPGIARGWAKEGRPALESKILDMSKNVENGHCDTTCASQIAAYLFDDVWKPYLSPEPSFGARQLRKLTRDEYARSVKDITGVQVDVAYLPADAPGKYFVYPGQASAGVFDQAQVKAYYDEAMRIATRVDPATLGYVEGSDHDAFVRALGREVFRRPLTDDEATRYAALLQPADDGMEGPRRLVAALLSSPFFLYRSELGEALQDKPDTYRLTPDEMATALSYGYLGTTPGKALLDQAEGGGLDTKEQVEKAIDAMVGTDDGKSQFLQFIRYYTRTTLPPDVKPGLDASLSTSMWNEQAMFVKDLIGNPSGTVSTLFNPGYTFLNKQLADHYGITGVTGDALSKVTLAGENGRRWGGLLQEGAFLASRAASDTDVTSMVRRGFAVRENLLCRQFATQENDNQPVVYPPRPVGMREHWNLRTLGTAEAPRTCRACHQYVNDLGASMEHYDQTAKYRDKEKAVNEGHSDALVDIDSRGPLLSNGGTQAWINFTDVRDISLYLPQENQAMHCLADGYFRFLYGNDSGTSGAQLVNDVAASLLSTGRLHDMLRQLGAADAMRYRKDPPATHPAIRPVGLASGPHATPATLHWHVPQSSIAKE